MSKKKSIFVFNLQSALQLFKSKTNWDSFWARKMFYLEPVNKYISKSNSSCCSLNEGNNNNNK